MIKRVSVDIYPKHNPRNRFVKWGVHPISVLASSDAPTESELVKFFTLADWTGMRETKLFAQTCKNYGLATVRYPVLEVTAMEPFEIRLSRMVWGLKNKTSHRRPPRLPPIRDRHGDE